MRVDLLLFAAILFACCNTLSTSAISTTARSLTSNHKDIAAHGVGVELAKEERMLSFMEFDKPIEGVNAIYSKLSEMAISMFFKASGKEVKAYNFLQLDRKNSIQLRNERYNAWLNYLAKKAKSSQGKMLGPQELKKDKILIELLAEFSKKEFPAILHAKVMSLLIHSWTIQELPSIFVFKHLKLNVKQSSDHSVYVDRLVVWIQFTISNYKDSRNEMVKVINEFDDDVRVMILSSLRQFKDTKNVVDHIERSLLSFLADKKVSVERLYTMLNLDQVYDKANFIVWVKYVVMVFDNLDLKEKEVVTKLMDVYGIEGLEKMLVALAINDAGKDLQLELMSKVMAAWTDDHMTWEKILPILEENHKIFKGLLMKDMFDK